MFDVTRVRFKKFLVTSIVIFTWLFSLNAISSPITLDISYVKLAKQQVAGTSNYFKKPENSGFQGAKLAISDSNTTGKFLQQHFSLSYFLATKSPQLLAYLDGQYQQGQRIFMLDVPLAQLVQLEQWAKNKSVLLFNVSETADELRNSQCLSSVLHTIPSDAMKSDALAQWLLYRRMNKVLLVQGSNSEDVLLKIIDEKQWDFNTDLRRSAQQEIPLFTQTVKDYDVVYVANKSKSFAEFLPFNTYLPRPVIGSAGLEALAWHSVIEQWGATQLQNRFIEMADRKMNELDFSAYLAVRSVAESVHKLHSNASNELIEYINSADFELAAYKGRKLSFRPWSRQLRMPLALVHPHALVSQSPQPGMLHPITELDTLGFDAQESQCELSR